MLRKSNYINRDSSLRGKLIVVEEVSVSPRAHNESWCPFLEQYNFTFSKPKCCFLFHELCDEPTPIGHNFLQTITVDGRRWIGIETFRMEQRHSLLCLLTVTGIHNAR